MEKKSRLAARYARIRLTAELQKVISGLPVRKMEEVTVGNLIYRGEGVITTGSVTYPARFSVAIEDGEIVAKLTSAAAGVEVHGGFKDEASRSDFIQRVRESVMAVHS